MGRCTSWSVACILGTLVGASVPFFNMCCISSFYSGPMTAESANFKITFFQEESSQTFRLWLYPERNAGKIQKESENESAYLLSEESVQIIAKLLTEKKLRGVPMGTDPVFPRRQFPNFGLMGKLPKPALGNMLLV
ncbi:hypothetical protein CEW92_08740 [Bacillaceae bacterium SAS-127]|nr:hypothetical protein CEW92_08740 [Bacillaceae bacterium SAS-127]